MAKLLLKSTHRFEIDVSYKLMETGSSCRKPLIVYLHGYGQNMTSFEKRVSSLLDIEAYHLFLQAPYVIYDEKRIREVSEWGRAWYLYDGDQDHFKESLEKSAGYIQGVLDEVCTQIDAGKMVLLGYSMGGYQAGYFSLSMPHYVDELVVIGGRIKTEYFSVNSYPDLKVLILHGVKDQAVEVQSAEESGKELSKLGADVSFYQLDEAHRLSRPYITKAKKWLSGEGLN